ncbi:SGNH/GDSL hydrolase family protein [Thalassotalea mangrovi]|uniref:SGNH/GDSL hydrolase family protein n=1 Tax=Thalassotalea mangrovi TaxID=2572245 RepID=UPI001FE837C4|nr:SGNH/GDSL hydrolase family protein [Thalassotalea mangrovi]
MRKRTPVLPEPKGSRLGVVGTGTSIKLLIIGDSAALGIGASHQREALLGQTLKYLSPHFRVQYQLIAKSGATTSDTLSVLETLPQQSFDAVITSLGVNDVTSSLTVAVWRQQQAVLRSLLQDKFAVKQSIITTVPPMHKFPALPNPLRWYLGDKANRFNDILAQDVEREHHCQMLNIDRELPLSAMATDGFHPGPPVYQHWGHTAARLIRHRF